MEIKTKKFMDQPHTYDNIESLAEHALDDGDYGMGQLEVIAATVDNQSKAIGRLLDVLADKNVIDADEVKHVLDFHGELTFDGN